MRRSIFLAMAFSLGILLLSAAGASAAHRRVPPGLSGASQYTETLPGPGGNESVGEVGAKGKKALKKGAAVAAPQTPAQVLGPRKARELESRGIYGRGAARLAAVGAPSIGEGKKRHRAGGAGAAKGVAGGAAKGTATGGATGASGGSFADQDLDGADSGSSPVSQVIGELTGTSDSGMGALLPLLIAASVLAAAVYLVGHRRNTSRRS